MANADKFGLLRKLLKALGLKPEAVDEIIDRIVELLSGGEEKAAPATLPYHVRDDFLTPAEHSFYLVLRQAVDDWAVVCPKVSLSDVFYAKSSDYSEYRTYTNKIDRKHIDFLLCETGTVRPMAGIELDDSSHQRRDRQERDEFVAQVFEAAGLPLVRVKVQRSYAVGDLRAELRSRLGLSEPATQTAAQGPSGRMNGAPQSAVEATASTEVPVCPACGSPMVLRTARRGPNAGQRFWGCTAYPKCREIVPYDG